MTSPVSRGSVVVISSGKGPPMTVETVYDDGTVAVAWFDVQHRLQRATFRLGDLKPYERPFQPGD